MLLWQRPASYHLVCSVFLLKLLRTSLRNLGLYLVNVSVARTQCQVLGGLKWGDWVPAPGVRPSGLTVGADSYWNYSYSHSYCQLLEPVGSLTSSHWGGNGTCPKSQLLRGWTWVRRGRGSALEGGLGPWVPACALHVRGQCLYLRQTVCVGIHWQTPSRSS